MKKRYSALLVLSLISTGAVLAAATTPLGKVMTAMGLDLMKIQTSITNPANNVQTLILLKDLREQAGVARTLTPSTIEGQADRITAYRAKIDELVDAIAGTEDSLNHGDQAGAQAGFARIKQVRGEGHAAFKPPTP